MGTEGKKIRIAIITLPVGLFVLGTASMLYTHLKPDRPEYDENYQKRMDAAIINRKPVNRADLERYVSILSQEIGERHLETNPEGLNRAAVWIQSTLKGGNLGYQVKSHIFPVGKTEVRNLSVELIGSSRRKEIVLIGAHYDSAPGSPGANSGGSGVAAVLSLAKALAGDPQQRTIRFVFFANKAAPYFQTDSMGSRVYAKRSAANEEKIVAMLSIDSIGCFSDAAGSQNYPGDQPTGMPSAGNFIALVGDENSRFRVDSAKRIISKESGIPVFPVSFPGLDSDQSSFWKYDYPAIMVTDTANYRYQHFNQPGDTVDKVDFARLETVCVGLTELVRAWANP